MILNRTGLWYTSPVTEISHPAGERWTSKTASWLGVGAAPQALLLGATIAQRYDGPMPLLSAIVGLTIMALLLWFQGLIGLVSPVGENSTLNDPRFFGGAELEYRLSKNSTLLLRFESLPYNGYSNGYYNRNLYSPLNRPYFFDDNINR